MRGVRHIPAQHDGIVSLDQFAVRVISFLIDYTDKDKLLKKLLKDLKPEGDLVDLIEAGMSEDRLVSHLEHHLDELLALLGKYGVLG